jgi:hypothetical protein
MIDMTPVGTIGFKFAAFVHALLRWPQRDAMVPEDVVACVVEQACPA